jgi:DNA-binding transcriptional MerR regulator
MPTRPERTYAISELAREFGVTARALRFYEDKGLLTPLRDGQARVYRGRDRARLQLILRGKRVGLSLQEIKDILDLYDLGDGQRAQMQVALKKFKARIVALEDQKRDILGAIESLREGIAFLEGRLAEPASPEGIAAARAFEKEARRRLGEGA